MARRTRIENRDELNSEPLKVKARAFCHYVLNPKSRRVEIRWAPEGAVTTGLATARNSGTRCLRPRRHARPAGAWATWVRGVYGIADSFFVVAFISEGEVRCTSQKTLIRCEGFGRRRISEQPMCRSSDSSSDAIFAWRWVVAAEDASNSREPAKVRQRPVPLKPARGGLRSEHSLDHRQVSEYCN